MSDGSRAPTTASARARVSSVRLTTAAASRRVSSIRATSAPTSATTCSARARSAATRGTAAKSCSTPSPARSTTPTRSRGPGTEGRRTRLNLVGVPRRSSGAGAGRPRARGGTPAPTPGRRTAVGTGPASRASTSWLVAGTPATRQDHERWSSVTTQSVTTNGAHTADRGEHRAGGVRVDPGQGVVQPRTSDTVGPHVRPGAGVGQHRPHGRPPAPPPPPNATTCARPYVATGRAGPGTPRSG